MECTRCHVKHSEEHFKTIRGRQTKRCLSCRNKENAKRKTYKCIHNKRRTHCRECGGGAFCEHDKRKSICRECGGVDFCIHDIQKVKCRECGGGAFCEHDREKAKCKECLGKKACIRMMISASRQKDRKFNIYDPNNFIDRCFLNGLFEDNPELKCPYCDINMTLDYDSPFKVSIERINNDIGHIKSNCILACLQCNKSRVGQR